MKAYLCLSMLLSVFVLKASPLDEAIARFWKEMSFLGPCEKESLNLEIEGREEAINKIILQNLEKGISEINLLRTEIEKSGKTQRSDFSESEWESLAKKVEDRDLLSLCVECATLENLQFFIDVVGLKPILDYDEEGESLLLFSLSVIGFFAEDSASEEREALVAKSREIYNFLLHRFPLLSLSKIISGFFHPREGSAMPMKALPIIYLYTNTNIKVSQGDLSDYLDTIELLLDNKESYGKNFIDERLRISSKGGTLLHLAYALGRFSLVEKLQTVNFPVLDEAKRCPFFIPAEKMQYAFLERFYVWQDLLSSSYIEEGEEKFADPIFDRNCGIPYLVERYAILPSKDDLTRIVENNRRLKCLPPQFVENLLEKIEKFPSAEEFDMQVEEIRSLVEEPEKLDELLISIRGKIPSFTEEV